MARRRSRREQGQALVIVALAAVVLVGASALAVDLSLNTQTRRTFQNVTDSASLAGAQDLGSPVSQSQRKQAVIDALSVIHNSIQWPESGGNDPTTLVTNAAGCTSVGSACDVTVSGLSGSYSGYTITVNTPPKNAHNTTVDGLDGYLETTVSQVVTDNLSGVIGFGHSTIGGHSVAYHFPSGQAFGFALYSKTYVTSGNDTEIISGDVYAQDDLNPQSSGQAFVCAAVESNGNGGNIVLGSPQYPGTPADGNAAQYVVSPPAGSGKQPDVIQYTTPNDCSTAAAGWVSQTSASASAHSCPASVNGMAITGSWDSNAEACVSSTAVVPSLEQPDTPTYTSSVCGTTGGGVAVDGDYSADWYKCTGSNKSALDVNRPLDPGVYIIDHNSQCNPTSCYDLTVDGSGTSTNLASGQTDCSTGITSPTGAAWNVRLCNVTFVLENGATVGVTGTGTTVYQTPYPQQSGQENPSDGRIPIYGTDSASALYVTNNGATYGTQGSLYMPNALISIDSNAFIDLFGQAIVGTWSVQSGNHQNPDITYDQGATAPQREVLRLIE